MRIGILLRKYFDFGGLQRDAVRFAEHLRKNDHEPVLVTSQTHADKLQNLEMIHIASRGWTNIQKERNFIQACETVLESAGLDTCVAFSRVPHAPYQFVGDFCYKEYLQTTKRQKMSWLPRYRFMLLRESQMFLNPERKHYFFLNEHQLKTYRSFYRIPEASVTLLPPWGNQTFLNQPVETSYKTELLQNLGISFEVKILLFVASNFHLKGLECAIGSLECNELSNAVLLVCGDDDHRGFAKFAAKRGLQNRVFFLGPRKDLPRLMRISDCLIHPARREAAGMILIEALFSELPVVCSEICGYAAEVQKAGGTVLPTDAINSDYARSAAVSIRRSSEIEKTMSQWVKQNQSQSASSTMQRLIEGRFHNSTQSVGKA